MGTWGPGNFENDNALDYLGLVLDNLTQTIEHNLSTEDGADFPDLRKIDSTLMPTVDILVALCDQYETAPGVDESTFQRWKGAILQGYDESVAGYSSGNTPHKVDRRKVIEDTFSKLELIVRNFSDH